MMQIIPYLLKLMLYTFICVSIIFNLFGVIIPFWGLLPEEYLAKIPKPILEFPLWAKILMSLFCASFWIIAYKMEKFQNLIRGISFVAVSWMLFMFVASLFGDLTKNYIGNYGLIIFLLPIAYSGFLFFKDYNDVGVAGEKQVFANKNTKISKEGFVFKTKSGIIILANPFRGIYVQGGAGSGKSASVFEPIIKQIAEQGYTGILYDFKSPELTNKVRASYSESNIKFKNIDFKNLLSNLTSIDKSLNY